MQSPHGLGNEPVMRVRLGIVDLNRKPAGWQGSVAGVTDGAFRMQHAHHERNINPFSDKSKLFVLTCCDNSAIDDKDSLPVTILKHCLRDSLQLPASPPANRRKVSSYASSAHVQIGKMLAITVSPGASASAKPAPLQRSHSFRQRYPEVLISQCPAHARYHYTGSGH